MNDNEVLQEFYKISISISGVFFPVFQALLYFIVEKSFNKFEFSRQELVGFYQKKGVIISIALIYLIIQPIFQLLSFTSVSHNLLWIYIVLMVIFRLVLLRSTGVWHTIHSTKFIPASANKTRKFVIACCNNSAVEKIQFIFFVGFLAVLPIISDDRVFTSVLTTLVYVLISTTFLLNNPLSIQREILKHEGTGEDLIKIDWPEEKIKNEEALIKDQIKNHYISGTNKKDISDMFEISISSEVNKTGELWNNISLEKININSRDVFKQRILDISKNFLIHLSEAKTDINSFVLSYHFYLEGKYRNIFIRTNKNEIEEYRLLGSEDFFRSLKNKLLDDILK